MFCYSGTYYINFDKKNKDMYYMNYDLNNYTFENIFP